MLAVLPMGGGDIETKQSQCQNTLALDKQSYIGKELKNTHGARQNLIMMSMMKVQKTRSLEM